MSDEKIIKSIAESLQDLCNKFFFTSSSYEKCIVDVRKELNTELHTMVSSGLIANYSIGNIEISSYNEKIQTQIHVQLANSPNAGIINIGARGVSAPEILAIQVPSDGKYEDRWNFIQEELEEQDEILINKEEYKQENRTNTGVDDIKRYMSKHLPVAR